VAIGSHNRGTAWGQHAQVVNCGLEGLRRDEGGLGVLAEKQQGEWLMMTKSMKSQEGQ
jgi:hypothetical protein